MKKKFLVLLAVAVLSALPAPAQDVTVPASGKRMDPTLRLVLPVQVGVSTILQADAPVTPLYKNFMINFEMPGVRWSARAIPVDINMAARWNFMNFGPDHAYYVGVPVRATLRFAKRGRVYASAAAEYLLHGTMHNMPWRCSVESGVSYNGFGLFASYGATPFFTTATGPGNTLSFGLVIGL